MSDKTDKRTGCLVGMGLTVALWWAIYELVKVVFGG